MCTKEVYIKSETKAVNMRITQEADYAIRICTILDGAEDIMGAAEISDKAFITQRFALKILRKLNEAGLTRSFKGAHGGYELAQRGEDIAIIDIIEAIDGSVRISKCLGCDESCSRNPVKSNCKMHLAFEVINDTLVRNLGRITVRMISDEGVSAEEVCALLK